MTGEKPRAAGTTHGRDAICNAGGLALKPRYKTKLRRVYSVYRSLHAFPPQTTEKVSEFKKFIGLQKVHTGHSQKASLRLAHRMAYIEPILYCLKLYMINI